jgi:hypothetical protein
MLRFQDAQGRVSRDWIFVTMMMTRVMKTRMIRIMIKMMMTRIRSKAKMVEITMHLQCMVLMHVLRMIHVENVKEVCRDGNIVVNKGIKRHFWGYTFYLPHNNPPSFCRL